MQQKIIGRMLKAASLLALLGLLLPGSYLGYVQLTDNFAAVVPGELFRSGQMSPESIENYVQREGIRSIINLRGPNTGSPWYDNEIATAERLGVEHLDFEMSARRKLNQARAGELVELMRTAPKPLLIHCLGGADRSGLASALYLAAIKKASESEAEDQISFYYGHLSLPFIPEYAMDRTFEAVEPWLGFHGS